jgi:hypothetical protein
VSSRAPPCGESLCGPSGLSGIAHGLPMGGECVRYASKQRRPSRPAHLVAVRPMCVDTVILEEVVKGGMTGGVYEPYRPQVDREANRTG